MGSWSIQDTAVHSQPHVHLQRVNVICGYVNQVGQYGPSVSPLSNVIISTLMH